MVRPLCFFDTGKRRLFGNRNLQATPRFLTIPEFFIQVGRLHAPVSIRYSGWITDLRDHAKGSFFLVLEVRDVGDIVDNQQMLQPDLALCRETLTQT